MICGGKNPFIIKIDLEEEQQKAFIQWLKDHNMYHPVDGWIGEIASAPVIKWNEIEWKYYNPFERVGETK